MDGYDFLSGFQEREVVALRIAMNQKAETMSGITCIGPTAGDLLLSAWPTV